MVVNIRALTLALTLLVSACTATEFKADFTRLEADKLATFEVKTRSISDYLKEIIRIKGIKKLNGDVVLEHPWYLPHTVIAHVEANKSYEVTLLCEKPLKLQFENPSATVNVAPECHYYLGCSWLGEGAKVSIDTNCPVAKMSNKVQ